jgi:hypothetical protein
MSYSVTVNGTAYTLPSPGDADWGAYLQAFFAALADTVSGTSPTWTAPTLANSWVNYSIGSDFAVGYRKDPTGRVWVRGTIKDGTAASGTVLFTLPTGYRPQRACAFPVHNNNQVMFIQINTTGTVVLAIAGTTNTLLRLDGISFDTAA